MGSACPASLRTPIPCPFARLAQVELQLVMHMLGDRSSFLGFARVCRATYAAAACTNAFAWRYADPVHVCWPPQPPSLPSGAGRGQMWWRSLKWTFFTDERSRPRSMAQLMARLQTPLMRHARVLLFWCSSEPSTESDSVSSGKPPTEAEVAELLQFSPGRIHTLYIRRPLVSVSVLKRLLSAPPFARQLTGFGFEPHTARWNFATMETLGNTHHPQLTMLELNLSSPKTLRRLPRLFPALTALDVSIIPEGVYDDSDDDDEDDEEQEGDAPLPAAAVAAAAIGADVLCIGEMTQLRELHLQGLAEQHWVPLLRSPSLRTSVRELSLRVVQRAPPRDLVLDWPSAFANIGAGLRCLTLECCFDANRILAAVTAHCGAQLSRLNFKPVQLETRKDSTKGKDDTCVPGRAQLHALLDGLPLLTDLRTEIWPRGSIGLADDDWERAHALFTQLVASYPKRVQFKVE